MPHAAPAVSPPSPPSPTSRPAYSSSQRPASHGCRFCRAPLSCSVVDLGMSPLSENFLTRGQLNQVEPFYPLHVYLCENCLLVQVEEYVSGQEIFAGEYAYFSSYSDLWLKHAADYVEMISRRLGLGPDSFVIELASNDGYLLRNFVTRGVPCLGIEPAVNCAEAAVREGVPTRVAYFGTGVARELVAEGLRPDLVVNNNVLAHVPDLNDFVAGIKALLAPRGVVTSEIQYVKTLIERNQFDTIYQEHYCYYSLHALRRVFARHGLTVFDVDLLPTHGGSLRVYARHAEDGSKPIAPAVEQVLCREVRDGFTEPATYTAFAGQVERTKRNLLKFLIEVKDAGKRVAGYGAPGKGNTLLNYCGVREDFLDYVVDRNPYKHGRFLAGTHVPVFPPDKLAETRPDYILILPWNLRDEIAAQLEYTRAWGAKLVVPIPELEVF